MPKSPVGAWNSGSVVLLAPMREAYRKSLCWPIGSATCWLKKLDEIAGWIQQKDLRAAWTSNSFIAKLDAFVLQTRNLCGKILNYEVNAVPAARVPDARHPASAARRSWLGR